MKLRMLSMYQFIINTSEIGAFGNPELSML